MRLNLAFDAGLARPGRAVVMHPPVEFDLNDTPAEIVHPNFINNTHWAKTHATVPQLPDGRWDMGIVCATRSKAQTRDLIAAVADRVSVIVVDGQKTDGIDSLYKDVRKRTAVHGTVTKAHGRIFWFDTADFSDWRAPVQTVAGFETRAGVFSADGIDAGTQCLLSAMPEVLNGRVLDLGAGWGVLAQAALDRGADQVDLVEADFVALSCAQSAITSPQASFIWADGTQHKGQYDWVVMNPPFHQGRKGTPSLGQAFIETAARCLTPRGTLWMVANAHLPYEATLDARFAAVERHSPNRSFKIFEAKRPKR